MRFRFVVTKWRKCLSKGREREDQKSETQLSMQSLLTQNTHMLCNVYASTVLKELHALNWMRIIFSVNLPSFPPCTVYIHTHTSIDIVHTAQANKFICWKCFITNTARETNKKQKANVEWPKTVQRNITRTVHTYIQYIQSWSTNVQKNCIHVKYVISE